MKRKETEVESRRKLSFWQIAAAVTIIGIVSYHLTGNTSLSTLLILLLLIFGTVKLLCFALQAKTFLAKLFLVILIMLVWLWLFVDKAFK